MIGQAELFPDWGVASEPFDEIKELLANRDLLSSSEAETRFHVIDRIIKEVLHWQHGQITVEEKVHPGYIDYILRSGDITMVVEAKKAGVAFPSPTRRKKLKLNGTVLGSGDIAKAIEQAEEYAHSINAQVVVVTNGYCWCFFPTRDSNQDSYAFLLFPFQSAKSAEELFRYLAEESVENGSLDFITAGPLPTPESRLLSEVLDADARVDRNNIADHIAPALNNALYADALLHNRDQLASCYVSTEARTKFDSQLGMHLADPRPSVVEPARRIRRRGDKDPLKDLVEGSYTPSYAPPLTLIIGPVGAGKSTYLKHFELVSGRELLHSQKARWVYIDFEEMGRTGDPRVFMYQKLKDYLLQDHGDNPIDYNSVVEPAYEEEIAGLARGPYNLWYRNNKVAFDKVVVETISKDLDAVEPYVDKIFSFLSQKQLCVIILDNIDLYEDVELEKTVFSEGLALSKKVRANVIVTIRDKTFVKHRNDSAFDAFELRKLWLDPPPLEAVLAARLKYSQKILKGKSAKITLPNEAVLHVPDLSIFFEIVQSSVLANKAGEFISAVADINIRRGLEFLTNFLTSGHVRAEEAVKGYMDTRSRTSVKSSNWFNFPFHEVFKGCVLGQWKHYKEARALCINLFDSRLGSKRLRLLRLHLLRHLATRAKSESTLEVPVSECIDLFSHIGASEFQIIETLNTLQKSDLIRNNKAEDIDAASVVVATRSGGYYVYRLSKMFVYTELCMYDTAVEDSTIWSELSYLTQQVEQESSARKRMHLRAKRMKLFLDYLCTLEEEALDLLAGAQYLAIMSEIGDTVAQETAAILEKMKRRENRSDL